MNVKDFMSLYRSMGITGDIFCGSIRTQRSKKILKILTSLDIMDSH